jgi:hypothetical protein
MPQIIFVSNPWVEEFVLRADSGSREITPPKPNDITVAREYL